MARSGARNNTTTGRKLRGGMSMAREHGAMNAYILRRDARAAMGRDNDATGGKNRHGGVEATCRRAGTSKGMEPSELRGGSGSEAETTVMHVIPCHSDARRPRYGRGRRHRRGHSKTGCAWAPPGETAITAGGASAAATTGTATLRVVRNPTTTCAGMIGIERGEMRGMRSRGTVPLRAAGVATSLRQSTWLDVTTRVRPAFPPRRMAQLRTESLSVPFQMLSTLVQRQKIEWTLYVRKL
jgi:hypothetical protein